MAKLRPETIILNGTPRLFENTAQENMQPGQFIEISSTGYSLVSTAGKNTLLRVVTEQDLLGKGIEDTIPSGENVTTHACSPGDVVLAYLPPNAPALIKGAQLELNASGNLVALAAGTPVAECWESIDNSASAEPAFIAVQAI